MKNRILALMLAIFAVVGVAEAQDAKKTTSITQNETTELSEQQCSDNAATRSSCLSFINGFLQGALLTDSAIIKSIEDSSEPTFAERAMRTRLGRKASEPTALAGFCLPAHRSIQDISEETLNHIQASKVNSAKLAQNVYDSLKNDYPCN